MIEEGEQGYRVGRGRGKICSKIYSAWVPWDVVIIVMIGKRGFIFFLFFLGGGVGGWGVGRGGRGKWGKRDM